MIEYALESLALSGVQEVFVVCCAHSDQIKNYIRYFVIKLGLLDYKGDLDGQSLLVLS